MIVLVLCFGGVFGRFLWWFWCVLVVDLIVPGGCFVRLC